ncbi:hypothetical protein LguiA_022494 [Lonicera macranthoides]
MPPCGVPLRTIEYAALKARSIYTDQEWLFLITNVMDRCTKHALIIDSDNFIPKLVLEAIKSVEILD